MKYEQIKVGDVFRYEAYVETVISKSDKHKIITTIDSNMKPTSWKEDQLRFLKPIKEELPKEGLLVSESGSLAYKLLDGSGYGFALGNQSYYFSDGWGFSIVGYWKPATQKQKKKFVEMLKTECKKHGLFEDTKLEAHADIKDCDLLNKFSFETAADTEQLWNVNGQIFYKGKFATPIKKEDLPEEGLLVSTAGSLVYKLSDGSGYGFVLGKQHIYSFVREWGFHLDGQWKPATPKQEVKFVDMLKKECKDRGLFEDTKIEKHANGDPLADPDYMSALPRFSSTTCYNKNGEIFYKGNFATPRKEKILELVSKASLDLSKFGVVIEQEGNILTINPVKKS